jgi:putative ABC transport system substrate-binding protein
MALQNKINKTPATTNLITSSKLKLQSLNLLSKLILFILVNIISISAAFAEGKALITVNQFVNHVALDKALDGVRTALKDRQILPDSAEVLISNAQGNISNSVQISKHQASLVPKFMVAIATPAAQTSLKAKGQESILAFVAVSDPVAANLAGHENVIGVSDSPPIQELLDIVAKIFPKLENIGVIYNSGEVNSVKITKTLELLAKEKGIKLHLASINSSGDIKLAMQKLAGKVDLIYLPLDNSVVSAIDSIVSISKSAKVPLICNDPLLVEHGVMIGLGANYFNNGLQLGNMIADIMEGKKLEQNIQQSKTVELKINRETAKYLDITIPDDLAMREQK